MWTRGPAIVLIGFMGSGKTSVARILGQRTGYEVFSTDEIVVAHFGLPISEVFARYGEAVFREAEQAALSELPVDRASVIDTGGGMVLCKENVAYLRQLGALVNLTASEEALEARTHGSPARPLLQTEDPRATIATMLRAREPIYRAAADISIETTARTSEEVAHTVLHEWARLRAAI